MRLLSWLKGLSIPKTGEYECTYCGKTFARDEIDSHICHEKAEALRKLLVELIKEDSRIIGVDSDFRLIRRCNEKS